MSIDIKEKLLTGAFFTGVFLPVRVLFYTYVSQFWLGSFGLITVILVSVMYFAHKGRMGRLGKIIDRQVMSFSKGKFGKLSIVSLCFSVYLYGLIIYGIENAPPDTKEMFLGVLAEEGITDLESAQHAENIGWTGPGASYGVLFSTLIILVPNKIGYTMYSIINDWTDGWVLHFATVFLIESLEALGLVLYFRYKK